MCNTFARRGTSVADVNSPSDALEWLNRIWGFIVGVVTAIAGMGAWVSNKISGVEEGVEAVRENLTEAERNIAVLQSSREEDQRRLSSIDTQTRDINRKLDDLIISLARGRE